MNKLHIASESPWLKEARQHIGKKEVYGSGFNLWIKELWFNLKGDWLWNQYKDDSALPWCGAFVGHCLKVSNLPFPKHWYRAKAYLDYGVRIDKPCLGCIVVFDRKGGGHVGFAIGKDRANRLIILGGNQGNQVSVMPFDTTRVLGYRMPFGFSTSTLLPIIANESASSESEA